MKCTEPSAMRYQAEYESKAAKTASYNMATFEQRTRFKKLSPIISLQCRESIFGSRVDVGAEISLTRGAS